MAGHSKWKNIQHRKGAQDAKRGKVFAKITKELTVAVKLAGADPTSNARLRLVLSKARAANMPKDNIDRAIKKGAGDASANNYSEKTYEATAYAGSAFLFFCLTDNANRTISEVRYVLSKNGAQMGSSVSWMFNKTGLLVYTRQAISDYEKFVDTAVENDAEDVQEEGEHLEIYCQPNVLTSLKQALMVFGVEPQHEMVTHEPKNWLEVDDAEQKAKILKLIEQLEDLEDVQEVYHNVKLD